MEGSLVAYKVFTNGSVLNASEINDNLMNQSVMVFSNATARAAALTAPVEGMLTWLEDVNRYENYNGSAWVALGNGVLQVVSQTKTDNSSGTNSSFQDVSGLSVSITPTSALSKVLVRFSIAVGYSTRDDFARVNLVRNSTNISQSTGGSVGQQTLVVYNEGTNAGSTMYVGEFLDSPSTTSSTTYKIQIATVINATETWYVNRYAGNDNFGSTSTITLMEVAG
jgi:hypothetical protein